jgi:hypothetical protein
MISRKLLLQRLQTVAPAGALHDLVPIFTHILFTGTKLVAYNDRFALSTPLQTEFVGTLPARILVDILKMSRVSHVDIQSNGEVVRLKLGAAAVYLETKPVQDYTNFFEMPAPPTENLIHGVAAQFFTGIKRLLLSTTEHATVADHLGITLIPNGQQLKMFSTDVATMSHCIVPLPPGHSLDKRIIVPPLFCREMLRLAKGARTVRLAVRQFPDDDSSPPRPRCDYYALFLADDVLLFSTLLESRLTGTEPVKFEEALQKHCEIAGAKKRQGIRGVKFYPLPAKLWPMLQRAARICDIKGNEVRSRVTVRNQQIEIASASARGTAHDNTALPGHPNVEVLLDAALLLKVRGWADQIRITTRSTMLTRNGTGILYFVASYM